MVGASDAYDSVAAWGPFKWMVERAGGELQQMVEIPEKSATAPPLRLKLLCFWVGPNLEAFYL